MLLQRLATGATGVNKRDTGEGQRQAYSARHSYAHAQYIHNAAVEFRRGFFTLVLSLWMCVYTRMYV